jgi:AcrR family transcriptional regulator
MTSLLPALQAQRPSRRDQQREQTRLDLALAAFELARAHGLAEVRVPQVAAAVGVSPRTFNNYFPSKEAAIVWPATLRGAQLAANLAGRPAEEPISEALVSAVAAIYTGEDSDGLPEGWALELRTLIGKEPSLRGEYLKTADVVEAALTNAIALRTGSSPSELGPRVLAAVVLAGERAGFRYWARQAGPEIALVELVRTAVSMAVRGTTNVE